MKTKCSSEHFIFTKRQILTMIKRKSTNKIILHCTATREGVDVTAKQVTEWHKQRGWETIGYHYLIRLDGSVENGRPEEMIGAHCTGQNSDSIGIVYVGGCDKDMNAKDTRTKAQKEALLDLVYILLQKYHLTIDNVYGHYQYAQKACPSFDIKSFKRDYHEAFDM